MPKVSFFILLWRRVFRVKSGTGDAASFLEVWFSDIIFHAFSGELVEESVSSKIIGSDLYQVIQNRIDLAPKADYESLSLSDI